MATAQRMTDNNAGGARDEICARIDQLERDFRLLSPGELGRRSDTIRRMTAANGLVAASRLAGGLGEAIARDGRCAMIRPYIEGMRDALGCDPADTHAGDIYLAAIGVRFAG